MVEESAFPPEAILQIVFYLLDDFPRLVRLNRTWIRLIKSSIRSHVEKSNLEENFESKYGSKLKLVKSDLSATPLRFCGRRGVRLDHVFRCQVLPDIKEIGKTLRIGYDF